MALRFRIATPDHVGCALPADVRSGPVWVQLAPIGDPVATADGIVPISEPVACQLMPPVDPEHQTWIAGELDERWGSRVTAVVAVRAGRTLTGPELIDHVGRQLADYKRPRQVVFAGEIPRSPTGKADRPAARRLAQEATAAS